MSHIFIFVNTHFSLNSSLWKRVQLWPPGNILLFLIPKILYTEQAQSCCHSQLEPMGRRSRNISNVFTEPAIENPAHSFHALEECKFKCCWNMKQIWLLALLIFPAFLQLYTWQAFYGSWLGMGMTEGTQAHVFCLKNSQGDPDTIRTQPPRARSAQQQAHIWQVSLNLLLPAAVEETSVPQFITLLLSLEFTWSLKINKLI